MSDPNTALPVAQDSDPIGVSVPANVEEIGNLPTVNAVPDAPEDVTEDQGVTGDVAE